MADIILKDVDAMHEKKIVSSGNNTYISMPKEYARRKAKVCIIKKEKGE